MKIIWIIRSLVFMAVEFSAIIIFATLGSLLIFASAPIRYAYFNQMVRFVLFSLKVICGVRYQVHGKEHLDLTKSGLILARHESVWETFAFQRFFPRQAFVLKKELLNIPFFGWGLRMTAPIAIDRGAGRQAMKQVLDEGTERLHNGSWVVIFPEGTRMPVGQLGKINAGGALLAQKAKVNTYLVAHDAGLCWPAKQWIIKPGVVNVYISAPLVLEDLNTKDINKLTKEWFQSHLSEKDIEKDSG